MKNRVWFVSENPFFCLFNYLKISTNVFGDVRLTR